MVMQDRRFETTYRFHLQGSSSELLNIWTWNRKIGVKFLMYAEWMPGAIYEDLILDICCPVRDLNTVSCSRLYRRPAILCHLTETGPWIKVTLSYVLSEGCCNLYYHLHILWRYSLAFFCLFIKLRHKTQIILSPLLAHAKVCLFISCTHNASPRSFISFFFWCRREKFVIGIQ
jgi:hypothetical protein